MNRFKKTALLAAVLGTLAAPAAHAATAGSFLDLSQLTFVTYGDISVVLDPFSNYQGSATANGLDDSSPLGAHANNGGAAGHAMAAPFSLNSFVNANAGYASADASAFSWGGMGNVTLSGNGVVVFTVPYMLAIDTTLSTDESAYSSVELSLNNYLSNFGTSVGDSIYAEKSLSSDTNGMKNGNGFLKLAYSFEGDSAAHFQLGARVSSYAESTVAVVPEPETYAMLLAGLGFIGAIARRRSSKA